VPDQNERSAAPKPTIVQEPADYWQVRLSPDDFDLALTILDPLLRTLDVFVLPLTAVAAVPQRLTRALAADTDPVWSPDSSRILFRSMQGGRPNLFTRAVRGGLTDEPLLRSDLDETPSDWQKGGILFHAPSGGALDIFSLVPGQDTPAALTRSGFNEFDGHWSPDGRSIAYVSDESGQPDVYVQDVNAPPGPSGTPTRVRVTLAGGTRPQWSRDGRALFFLRDGQLLRADRTIEGFTTPRAVLPQTGVRDYSLAHRNDRVLLVIPRDRSEPATAGLILDWRN
jgi:Tol biopolymer transport system component